MRSALARLGVRGTVALGLAIFVLVIVGVARLAGGGVEPQLNNAAPRTAPTVDPTDGDDGEVAATPSAFADDGAVRRAAKDFTEAWLRRTLSATAWHASIAAFATLALARKLDGVDPRGVPATRALGEPTLSLRTNAFAQASIPVDTGTLVLNLLKQDGRWRVDAVDWERT